MKTTRILKWLTLFMLLHHEPGVCAPPDNSQVDPEQVARIRQALQSQDLNNLTRHEKSMQGLRAAPVENLKAMHWAAREAIEPVKQRFDLFQEETEPVRRMLDGMG